MKRENGSVGLEFFLLIFLLKTIEKKRIISGQPIYRRYKVADICQFFKISVSADKFIRLANVLEAGLLF